MFIVEVNHVSKGKGEGSLEWTIEGKGTSRSYEEVEQKTECGEADDNAGDNSVDEVEVVGEGVSEEEESGLEHQG